MKTFSHILSLALTIQIVTASFAHAGTKETMIKVTAALSERFAGVSEVKEGVLQSIAAQLNKLGAPKESETIFFFGGKVRESTEILEVGLDASGLNYATIDLKEYHSEYELLSFKNTIDDFLREKKYSVFIFKNPEAAHPLIQNELSNIIKAGFDFPSAKVGFQLSPRIKSGYPPAVWFATGAGQVALIPVKNNEGQYVRNELHPEELLENFSNYNINKSLLDLRSKKIAVHLLSDSEYEAAIIKNLNLQIKELGIRHQYYFMYDLNDWVGHILMRTQNNMTNLTAEDIVRDHLESAVNLFLVMYSKEIPKRTKVVLDLPCNAILGGRISPVAFSDVSE